MFRLISISLIVFCSLTCKNTPVESIPTTSVDPFPNLPSDSIVIPRLALKSNIKFSLYEVLYPTGRTVTVIFETKELFPGSGCTIVGALTRNGTNISVQLDSVQRAGFEDAESRAFISFKLGILSNNLYIMTILTNEKKIESLILVSDTSYIMKVQPNDMISASYSRLLRIPKNTIWGRAESITPSLHQQFIDSLNSNGAKYPALPIGYYKYFTVVSSDSFTIPFDLGMHYGQSFLFQFNGDTIVTRALVKTFGKQNGDSAFVRLMGGRGEWYDSDILRYEP